MHPHPIIIVMGIVFLSVGIVGLKGLRELYKKTGDLGPGRGLAGIVMFLIFGVLSLFMGVTGLGLKKSEPSHPETLGQPPAMKSSVAPKSSP